MARIVGVNLPPQKRIEIGLTYIFGIGHSRANKILEKVKIDKNKKVKDLSIKEIEELRKVVDSYRTEGVLKRDVRNDIKRLKDIGSYRGSRHSKRLPVRGQRTKTNSRTMRGNIRKTAGSGRRPAAKKT
jgi:small subunit ribosomal protein S13